MKKTAISLSFVSFSAFANPVGYLKDYKYQVTDISTMKLNRKEMFNGMVKDWLDLEDSICANRAHLWGYDLTRFYGINTGKIFIFFGASIWRNDKKGWMYHVAPYIVDDGKEYVMEASYPENTEPVTVEDWIEGETYNRVKGSDCVEITAQDTDLTAYFYERFNLPEYRERTGKTAPCYIRKVPGHFWYPAGIAYHDLKKDEKGREIEYNPTSFEVDDVMDACKEAASSKLFNSKKGNCKKHILNR